MKYPVLIPYIKSQDNGMELRYALRSLKNLKDWNGEVFIVGDTEKWFKNITHIRCRLRSYGPNEDVENKILTVLQDERLPDDFILMNDDFYVTKPTNTKVLHQGELKSDDLNYYQRAKTRTANFLKDMGIETPLDYGLHVPMLMNKQKRLEVHNLIKGSFRGTPLQARSVYGNIFKIGGDFYEDKKTKTGELKSGLFISTQYYTDELDNLFPEPSQFERPDITVYDDTERDWSRRFARTDRSNGAKTYTEEIKKYQIPLWEKHIGNKSISISTTNLINRIKDFTKSDFNVQYLHTYPKDNPQKQINPVTQALRTNQGTIFVCSYKSMADEVNQAGYKCIYIPMTIDDTSIPKQSKTTKKKSIIYYGNVTEPKLDTFNKLRNFYKSKGWTFDYISSNQFNGTGKKLTQQECWDIIKDYKYGIGVGRCYMEMSAIGLKCIVAGNNIGGITLNKDHHKKQVETNYNSNYFTFSDDLNEIHKNLPKVKPQYEDIKKNIGKIETEIKSLLQFK